MKRFLSPALCGLVLVCFFLPWVNISCQGQPLVSLTGTQLVTGTTVEPPEFLASRESHRIPPDLFAILAALCTVAGLALGLLKGRTGPLAAAAAALLGLVFLLVLKARADDAILKNGAGMLKASYGAGFWLALLLLLAAVGAGAWAFLQPGERAGRVGASGGGQRFCTRCGAPNPGNAGFCGSCGAPL